MPGKYFIDRVLEMSEAKLGFIKLIFPLFKPLSETKSIPVFWYDMGLPVGFYAMHYSLFPCVK